MCVEVVEERKREELISGPFRVHTCVIVYSGYAMNDVNKTNM